MAAAAGRADRGYGYAGGLGPANIAAALDFAARFDGQRLWLDMETGVRDRDDWLDLDAVEAVCEEVARRGAAPAAGPGGGR